MINRPGRCSGENNSATGSRHSAAIETLMEIARALASPHEIEEVLQEIMSQVNRLLKPMTLSLLLKDDVSGELESAVVISNGDDHLDGADLPAGHGAAVWATANDRSLIIPDVRCNERFAAEFDNKLSFTARSVICVPIKSHDKVFGVILLINSINGNIFDAADEQILTAIADFAGVAISNAKALEKIQQLVITDDLTGLFNSRYFFEQIEYEVERSKRYNSPLSLVFLDLDHFKNVNDTYGHLTGSRLLAEVGSVVSEHIRKTDKAARYGGDEFVIILPQTEKSGAFAFALKLHSELNKKTFYSNDGAHLTVSGSFGVASFPADAHSSAELVSKADEAMYLVKKSGRNGVLVAESAEFTNGSRQ